MAVKRTIPRIYVILAFAFFSVEVLYRQSVKRLDYLSVIGQLDNLELERAVRIRSMFALIFYKNRPLHIDFLNAAGISFLLGPILYLFRFFWWV